MGCHLFKHPVFVLEHYFPTYAKDKRCIFLTLISGLFANIQAPYSITTTFYFEYFKFGWVSI